MTPAMMTDQSDDRRHPAESAPSRMPNQQFLKFLLFLDCQFYVVKSYFVLGMKIAGVSDKTSAE